MFFSLKGVCLGGGNSIFLFSALCGEDVQFDLYFSDGLKPPTGFAWSVLWKKRKRGSKMVSILFRSTLYTYIFMYICDIMHLDEITHLCLWG